MSGIDFEPSRGVRKIFLYTRKSSSPSYGGVILPGLFQSSGIVWDMAAFILILFGEFYGYFQIESKSSMGSATMFVALIIADFILAFVAQGFIGGILKRKNQVVLERNGAISARLRSQMSFLKVLAYLFKAGILFIAFFKIFTFYGLKWGKLDPEMLLMIFIYLGVGLLHIACTGYFFAYVILKVSQSFQRFRHFSSSSAVKPYQIIEYRFSNPNPIGNEPYKTGDVQSGTKSHQVVVEKEDWRLQTWGVLEDDQLESLIWKQDQNDNTKREVALAGLAHQLSML
jgi:hypothetical protein